MCSFKVKVSSAYLACVLLKFAFGAPSNSGTTVTMENIPTVSLKIKIPDSNEVVDTDVALNSSVPACIKKDPATLQEDGTYTVTAEIFTECARRELSRLQKELEKQPQNTSTGGVRGNKAEKDPEPQEPINQDHERVNQDILAQHGIRDKHSSAKESGASDVVMNATTEAVKAVTTSNDMLSVLQTVFDYKRVMNDLRRILRGDVFGVLGDYPGRMNGLFKMIHELPRRIMKSIGIVNRLRTSTNDTTFRGFLTNLRDYLSQASQTTKNLPDAFNMISVVETLRSVASKIGERPSRRDDHALNQRAFFTGVGGLFEAALYNTHIPIDHGRSLLSRAISFPERLIPASWHPTQVFDWEDQHATSKHS